MAEIKVRVGQQNALKVRVGQQNAVRVISSSISSANISLSELYDVNATNLSDGMVLVYNESIQKWDAVSVLDGGSY